MAEPLAPTATGVVSRASPLSLPATLARFEQLLRDRGLSLFAQLDQGAEAARVGLALRPTHLLLFGSPRAGTPLMGAIPLVALDLPLKVLIWQADTGEVWITYQDAAFIAQRYAVPAELAAPLAGVAALVEAAVTVPGP